MAGFGGGALFASGAKTRPGCCGAGAGAVDAATPTAGEGLDRGGGGGGTGRAPPTDDPSSALYTFGGGGPNLETSISVKLILAEGCAGGAEGVSTEGDGAKGRASGAAPTRRTGGGKKDVGSANGVPVGGASPARESAGVGYRGAGATLGAETGAGAVTEAAGPEAVPAAKTAGAAPEAEAPAVTVGARLGGGGTGRGC